MADTATTAGGRLRLYLLHDTAPGGRLWLASGVDCVAAARSLIGRVGGTPDVNRFSVGGSWPVEGDLAIEVSKWWPYFTADPEEASCG